MSFASNFPELAAFYQKEVIAPGHELIRRILQRGMDRGEAFGFINFFGDPKTAWDKIVLTNNNYSGFESDNYTTRATAWNPLVDGVLPGIPVALVSGDDACIAEVVSLFGDVETVTTKRSLGFFAAGARKRALAEAGVPCVTAREADDLVREAESFLERVVTCLGVTHQPTLPTGFRGAADGARHSAD